MSPPSASQRVKLFAIRPSCYRETETEEACSRILSLHTILTTSDVNWKSKGFYVDLGVVVP